VNHDPGSCAFFQADLSRRGASLRCELEITTGTMSLRLERLSHAALIVRAASPTDGRSHAVRLTEAGHEKWRTATAERIHRERQLVGGPLTTNELEQLNRLLRKTYAERRRRARARSPSRAGPRPSRLTRAKCLPAPTSGVSVRTFRPAQSLDRDELQTAAGHVAI